MRDLIGNHLNSNPVGLGNSKSDMETSVLSTGPMPSDTEDGEVMPADESHETSEPEGKMAATQVMDDQPQQVYSSPWDDEALFAPSPTPSALHEDPATEGDMTHHTSKRKTPPEISDDEDELMVVDGPAQTPGALVKATTKDKGKSASASASKRPATSLAAETPSKSTTKTSGSKKSKGDTKGAKKSKGDTKGAKKLKYADNFAEIAIAEEQTKQKHLELEKLKLKGAVKSKSMRLRVEMEKAKLEAMTQYHLAKLRMGTTNRVPHGVGFQAQAQGQPPMYPGPRPSARRGTKFLAPPSFDNQGWFGGMFRYLCWWYLDLTFDT